MFRHCENPKDMWRKVFGLSVIDNGMWAGIIVDSEAFEAFLSGQFPIQPLQGVTNLWTNRLALLCFS